MSKTKTGRYNFYIRYTHIHAKHVVSQYIYAVESTCCKSVSFTRSGNYRNTAVVITPFNAAQCFCERQNPTPHSKIINLLQAAWRFDLCLIASCPDSFTQTPLIHKRVTSAIHS